MSNSFQHGIPKGRVNTKLGAHTSAAPKEAALSSKFRAMGSESHAKEIRLFSEREKTNTHRNNINSVLAEFNSSLNLAIGNTLAGDKSDEHILFVNCSCNQTMPKRPPLARRHDED